MCYRRTWSSEVARVWDVDESEPPQSGPGIAPGDDPDRVSQFAIVRVASEHSRSMIEYVSPRAGVARLDIFDVRGRRVYSLPAAPIGTAGTLVWGHADSQGNRVASGMYFIRIDHEGYRATSRVSVVR